MNVMTMKQVITAHGQTPEEFDRDLNSKVEALAKKGIACDVQLNTNAGLVAHIFYTKTLQAPETVADEFRLRGERHYCYECPYFVAPTDGRVKKVRCRYAEPYTTAEAECCEVFYKRLLLGEIELGV